MNMNFDEFMLLFGRESEDDIEEAEVVEPATDVAEADSADDADVVTTTDNNNSADLDGDVESNAFLTDDSAPEEHDEADVDMDPSGDILEEIADSDETLFEKQMKVPTVSDDETVFDKLQEQTDVQVHNFADKEQEILDDAQDELQELLKDSGDTWDEGELDAIPENQDAEVTGGVDPLTPAEHPVTAMLNDRIEDIEKNHMMNVSTKDTDFDADDFLADDLNGDSTDADADDGCDAEPAEAPVDDVAAVTEDEESDVVPEGAEPEDDDEESEDTEVEADDTEEAPAEDPVDTSEVEITGDEAPVDTDDESGDGEDGNIFDDPETFVVTDDVVEKQRMAEYTFKPTVSPDEFDDSVADAETVVKDDDVEVQEVEGTSDDESEDVAETTDTETDSEEVSEEPEDAEDVESEDTEEASEEETETEANEEDTEELAKEDEDADVVPEGAEPEDDEETEEVSETESDVETEVEAEAEIEETDDVSDDAEPVTADAPTADPEGDSDVETISACIRNDLESDPDNLYKEEDGAITVGDDSSALDNASGVVDDGDTSETPAEDGESDNPADYQDVEDAEVGSQDLSEILAELLDEPHEIESEEGGDVEETSDVEAEVVSEPTEDVEAETESDVEDAEVEEADQAIESLFANLDNFRL